MGMSAVARRLEIEEMFRELQPDLSPLGLALSHVSTAFYNWKKKPRLFATKPRREKQQRCRVCHPGLRGNLALKAGLGRANCPTHRRRPPPAIDGLPPVPPSLAAYAERPYSRFHVADHERCRAITYAGERCRKAITLRARGCCSHHFHAQRWYVEAG